jgi:dihydropteroate synthase
MPARFWQVRDRRLSLAEPLVMGILNVTPDSFSDGGRFVDADKAVKHAIAMVKDGADIIDVGGESTRPGAAPVPEDVELARVIPVVKRLARRGIVVSVDTSSPRVMREALDCGAAIINDVRSFTRPGALRAVAGTGAGVVIMHMQGDPRTMQNDPRYDDVTAEVLAFLAVQDARLLSAGIPEECICWDPGFGFAKNVEHNFRLLADTEKLASYDRPVLVGLSRKSSIGIVTGIKKPEERVHGSVAAHLLAVLKGASVLRVHDVRAMRSALDVLKAMRQAKG